MFIWFVRFVTQSFQSGHHPFLCDSSGAVGISEQCSHDQGSEETRRSGLSSRNGTQRRPLAHEPKADVVIFDDIITLAFAKPGVKGPILRRGKPWPQSADIHRVCALRAAHFQNPSFAAGPCRYHLLTVSSLNRKNEGSPLM